MMPAFSAKNTSRKTQLLYFILWAWYLHLMPNQLRQRAQGTVPKMTKCHKIFLRDSYEPHLLSPYVAPGAQRAPKRKLGVLFTINYTLFCEW